jgi:hypothetical protein
MMQQMKEKKTWGFLRKKWIIVGAVIILCLSVSYVASREFRRFVCKGTGRSVCYAVSQPHPEGELTRHIQRKMKRISFE